MELTPYFEKYEALVAEVDAVFARVAGEYPECIACKSGCSDCCHALFDLSLVEAVYLNHAFGKTYGFGAKRSSIMQAAADADRQLTKMKKDYFKTMKEGEGNEEAVAAVMREASRARVRCPLLVASPEGELCGLYRFRPITCRLYGIPTAIGGKGHVCGKSGFAPGKGYPTVHVDKIQERLDALSLELQTGIGSRFKELHMVYVPVSMALITKYDDVYMGLAPAPEDR